MSRTDFSDWSATFGQMEAVLSEMSQVQRSRQSSFQFRLKNLFKAGFLPHVASGRGKAGRYSAGDVFVLAVAVELMQFELGPYRIKATINRLRDVIMDAAHEVGEHLMMGMPDLDVGQHMYLSFDPGGLSDLSRELGDEQRSTERIYRGTQPIDDRIARRLAVINMSRLGVDLGLALSSTATCSTAAFGQQLSIWAKTWSGVFAND